MTPADEKLISSLIEAAKEAVKILDGIEEYDCADKLRRAIDNAIIRSSFSFLRISQ